MKIVPDIILHNGTIRTQDDAYPIARAVAISDKRILSLGSDRDVLRLASKNTLVIDLDNRLVLPGFIDTHFHFYEWALNYDSIDFSSVCSFKEMEEIVSKKALAVGSSVLSKGIPHFSHH